MGTRITSRVTFSAFTDVAKTVHGELVRAVAATAGEVRADAQGHARVDTGAMRDSVYVLSRAEDGYGEAVAAAEADRPGVAVFDPLERPQGDTEALIAAAVAHAERIEMGPHPFLTPAADDNRHAFEYDARRAVRDGARRATRRG